ncbi:hypothetical protein D3C71_2216410 [compost metagenome]
MHGLARLREQLVHDLFSVHAQVELRQHCRAEFPQLDGCHIAATALVAHDVVRFRQRL